MRTLGWSVVVILVVSSCKREAPLAPARAPIVAVAPTVDLSVPGDAQTTTSGLRTKVLRAGSGREHPALWDIVEAHATGWKSDGTIFDDSRARNAPMQFTVSDVTKGWSEGLQLMVAGERRKLWIPAALAYGEKPTNPHFPAGPLVMDVELLTIIKRPAPLPAPADLAAPPAGATKTKLGLVYRVLKKGSGAKHPRPDSFVEFHYTGWDAEGRMLESTVGRDDPSKIRVQTAGRVWTEALSTMVTGEKARFWIPASLAREMGGPGPSVVYDVELLAIR